MAHRLKNNKARLVHKGTSWKDKNRYEVEGHLDASLLGKFQYQLGFPVQGYGEPINVKKLHDPITMKKVTQWESSGSCE